MKIMFIILMLFSNICLAEEDKSLKFDPTVTLGLGVDIKIGPEPDLMAGFLKVYTYSIESKEVAIRFLGVGITNNTLNQKGFDLSPIAFCVYKNCLAPDFIFYNTNLGGMSLSLSRSF